MSTARIALANLRYPPTPDESVTMACQAIEDAGAQGAELVCFPECYVPGYRGLGYVPPPPDEAFLERAWLEIAAAARKVRVGVVLGTERLTPAGLVMAALVIQRDGALAGFQEKEQIDFIRPMPAATGHPRSQTRRTRSTKRPHCVARLRTRATSPA